MPPHTHTTRPPSLKFGLCVDAPRAVTHDHMGRVDYHGAVVNMAARFLDAAAWGGQVVCTESTALDLFSPRSQHLVQAWQQGGSGTGTGTAWGGLLRPLQEEEVCEDAPHLPSSSACPSPHLRGPPPLQPGPPSLQPESPTTHTVVPSPLQPGTPTPPLLGPPPVQQQVALSHPDLGSMTHAPASYSQGGQEPVPSYSQGGQEPVPSYSQRDAEDKQLQPQLQPQPAPDLGSSPTATGPHPVPVPSSSPGPGPDPSPGPGPSPDPDSGPGPGPVLSDGRWSLVQACRLGVYSFKGAEDVVTMVNLQQVRLGVCGGVGV